MPAPQMRDALLLQDAARLNVETPVERLRRHAHRGIVRILRHEPPRDLLGRPVFGQLGRDGGPQRGIVGQHAALGALRVRRNAARNLLTLLEGERPPRAAPGPWRDAAGTRQHGVHRPRPLLQRRTNRRQGSSPKFL